MLKIKEKTDEEYKKLGFKKMPVTDLFDMEIGVHMYYYCEPASSIGILFYDDSYILQVYTKHETQEDLYDIIFDLIQAGLVEKVD